MDKAEREKLAREVLARCCPGLVLNESEKQGVAVAMLAFADRLPDVAAGERLEADRCGAVSEDAIAHLAIRSQTNRAIYKAVRGYFMANMRDEDGYGYPLVDLMSNPAPSDIGTGEMEMIALVDEIEAAVSTLAQTPSPKPAGNPVSAASGEAWYPETIGRLHLGAVRGDGERECAGGCDKIIPAGQPVYWPERLGEYPDDVDPSCLECAISKSEGDQSWCERCDNPALSQSTPDAKQVGFGFGLCKDCPGTHSLMCCMTPPRGSPTPGSQTPAPDAKQDHKPAGTEREALKPFAAIADWWDDALLPDDHSIYGSVKGGTGGVERIGLTLGDCRRARNALALISGGDHAE